jgi:hypothetical protein
VINFTAIAPEIFQILRSRNFVVDLYDDVGNKVIEPEEARRFYINDENHLVALVDSNDNSTLKVRLSKTADMVDLRSFLSTLRNCANKYNMLFDAKKGDREYHPKDFATQFSVTNEGKTFMQDLTEGMYGTSRSSYLKLENAKMIVRHSERINEEMMGARSRKIESIFIENAQGERMLFPTRQLPPARAMVSHVDHGGSFHDAVGEQFQRMAVDFQNLGQCSAFVHQNGGMMSESAGALREGCREKLREMRRMFERCYRSETGYLNEVARIQDAGEPALVEGEIMESLRSTLACEGKVLDDAVIESVARLVGNSSSMIAEEVPSDERLSANPEEAKKFTAVRVDSVRTFHIDPVVWENLTNGKIDLMDAPAPSEDPDKNRNPNFTDKTTESLFKFDQIVPQIKDDRLIALCSYVGSELPELLENPRPNQKAISLMKLVVKLVLKAANVNMDPIVTPAIREFVEWFKSFDADRVLLREGYHDYTELEARAEQAGPNSAQKEIAASDVISTFRVADFLASDYASDFQYGDVNPHMPDDERSYSVEYVRSSLAGYLSSIMSEEHGVEDDDMADVAKDLWPAVKAKLELDGYILTDEKKLKEGSIACGQCEGTGTIEGGLGGDGEDEECPVCDGSGQIADDEDEEDGGKHRNDLDMDWVKKYNPSLNESQRQLYEGVGFEGILTTNSKGIWSSQGRGVNDDGVQGFYYTTELSDGVHADLFVHDGERAYNLVVANGDQVNATQDGTYNTAFDLASQVDEIVQQHGMAPADMGSLDASALGAMDSQGDLAAEMGVVAPVAGTEAPLPTFGGEADIVDAEFSTGSLDADTAWTPGMPIAEPEIDEEYDINSFDRGDAMYDGRGDDDDRYSERDAYDIEDEGEADEVFDVAGIERDINSFDMHQGMGYDGRGDDDIREEQILLGGEDDGGDELTREDVLLPKDGGANLGDEVAADIDGAEVERIATLAGVRKSSTVF